MPPPSRPLDPKLVSLLDLFPGEGLSHSSMELVEAAQMPEPYRRLLVHRHHMTVTLEEYYGSPVKLNVLARRREGDDYARKLLLTVPRAGGSPTEPSERGVLVGAMRFHLQHTKPAIREAIVSESAPLGRILIENEVLRSIEPRAYLRVRLTPELRRLFQASPGHAVTYGRLALIIVHNSPAVELLEIVSPEPARY